MGLQGILELSLYTCGDFVKQPELPRNFRSGIDKSFLDFILIPGLIIQCVEDAFPDLFAKVTYSTRTSRVREAPG
jgi:hypothetical protein